ncbi:MAG: tripartite tricarboxylate transporter TctB family protein [Chloroflexi bacterium]|nr:tripartite tricarboxylate transporter TctB family protein [Chloroflexota bacterium]
MRPYQVATAAIFLLIAAVAMFDTRSGALPTSAAGVPGGLRGGWYPFWSGAVVAVAAIVVGAQTLRRPDTEPGVFKDRGAVLYLAKFILPMIVTTYLMSDKLLGFYVATAAYVAYYAGLVARYRWYWAVLAGIAIPLVIYLVFEVAFKALLPKSVFYPTTPF